MPVLPKLIKTLRENGVEVSMAYTYADAEKSLLRRFWQTIMIEELFQIERDAYRDSVIHRLDARVKIVLAFAAIIALVAVPYSTMVYTVGAIFFIFFIVLWAVPVFPLWSISNVSCSLFRSGGSSSSSRSF